MFLILYSDCLLFYNMANKIHVEVYDYLRIRGTTWADFDKDFLLWKILC